jgi:glycosyltransferase involved in cell wall biosynthesis
MLGDFKNNKVVIASAYYPPNISGTSTVLRNLANQLAPNAVSIVTENQPLPPGNPGSPVPEGIRVYKTGIPRWLLEKIPYIWRWERYFRFALIPAFRYLTLRAIKETGADCILAVYPNWPCLIGSYLAHRRTGLPFYTYHMDIPVRRSAIAPFEGWFIDNYESKILSASQNRLIISEGYAQDFKLRFGLGTTFLPHTLELEKRWNEIERLPPPSGKKPYRIVHTGIVVGQKEGLLRIARAIHENPGLEAKLILSTPTPAEELLQAGFDLPCVEILSLPQEEVVALQASAHILVTVLPFYGKTKEGALTSYPTKLTEYLSTGRPILIHAPEWSFLVRHAKFEGYAVTVDRPDTEALAAAIRTILQGGDGIQSIRENASQLATKYDIRKVTMQFLTALGLPTTILKNPPSPET